MDWQVIYTGNYNMFKTRGKKLFSSVSVFFQGLQLYQIYYHKCDLDPTECHHAGY